LTLQAEVAGILRAFPELNNSRHAQLFQIALHRTRISPHAPNARSLQRSEVPWVMKKYLAKRRKEKAR
jgi:hypothetical protein